MRPRVRDDDWTVAEAELREAAIRDISAWLRFEIGAGRPVGDRAQGVRLPTIASVGPTEWATFHLDLVGSVLGMTGEPKPTPPFARVVMPDVEQPGYRAYPLIDHIADRVVAIFQLYGEQRRRPSTRHKDLVDLVSIATKASVAAGPQLMALASEAERHRATDQTRLSHRWSPHRSPARHDGGRNMGPERRTRAILTCECISRC